MHAFFEPNLGILQPKGPYCCRSHPAISKLLHACCKGGTTCPNPDIDSTLESIKSGCKEDCLTQSYSRDTRDVTHWGADEIVCALPQEHNGSDKLEDVSAFLIHD